MDYVILISTYLYYDFHCSVLMAGKVGAMKLQRALFFENPNRITVE